MTGVGFFVPRYTPPARIHHATTSPPAPHKHHGAVGVPGSLPIVLLEGLPGWLRKSLPVVWEPAVKTAPEGALRRKTRLRWLGIGEVGGEWWAAVRLPMSPERLPIFLPEWLPIVLPMLPERLPIVLPAMVGTSLPASLRVGA